MDKSLNASDKWVAFENKQDNIFNLRNPSMYTCAVQRYERGHPYIWIEAYIYNEDELVPKDIVHLIFESPCFFDGPLMWVGADFRLGTPKEMSEIIDGLGWKNRLDERAIQELHLFVANNGPEAYKVRILATDGYSTTKLRESFLRS